MRIGFICSGNTCRSPMAECMFRAMDTGIPVFSAGIRAAYGMPANGFAMDEMENRGLSLAYHRSQPLTAELAKDALLLCMTEAQLSAVCRLFPEAKADTLMHYAGLHGDVTDPFGGDEEDYFIAAERIARALERIWEKVKNG